MAVRDGDVGVASSCFVDKRVENVGLFGRVGFHGSHKSAGV